MTMVSTRKKKSAPPAVRRRRPKPAWDPNVQDHSQYKLSKEEQARRKDLYTSRNQLPGVERLRELCEKYEGPAAGEVENAREESPEDLAAGGVGEAHVEEEAAHSSEREASTSRLGNVETFDELAQHADKYGKLDPHEIMFEYRTSNRAQKIVDNIQQIIDINISRIDTMMSQMDVGTIKKEVEGIKSDVDDMKETQLVLRDEIKSMRKEFGDMMSNLQRNFQSLLTDKYNPRTQFSARQLDSAPYPPASEAQNALSFSDSRSPLPSVPIRVRRTPQQPSLYVDGDDDDIELPLYSDMMESLANRPTQ